MNDGNVADSLSTPGQEAVEAVFRRFLAAAGPQELLDDRVQDLVDFAEHVGVRLRGPPFFNAHRVHQVGLDDGLVITQVGVLVLFRSRCNFGRHGDSEDVKAKPDGIGIMIVIRIT